MSFTLRQLRYFIAVAEAGAVTSASQGLGISQSAVTEALKALEFDLGVQLFERRRHGLAVTHEGQQFLRHATRILAAVSDARRSFAQDVAKTGELNLGVTSLVAGYVLPDMLARYRRAHPAIEIRAIEETAEYLEHLLIGGEIDVAVMEISELSDRSAFQIEVFETSDYGLWLPIGHRLAERDVVDLSDIAQEPLILLAADELARGPERLQELLGARPNVAFRSRSVEAVRSLVATGAGVALLPGLIYRPWSLEGDRIENRRVSGELPGVEVGLVWRRGSSVRPSVRDLVETARLASQARSRN